MLKRFTLVFTFFALSLLTLKVKGQFIEGNVKADKGKELEAVTLLLKATGTSAATDSAGNYRIPTTYKGKTWLICNAIGYQKDSVLLDLKGQTIKKDWKLKSASNELNTVRVSSVLKRISGQKTISTLNDLEIATTAGAAADVVAALQTLPGAAPAGNETGLFVRGGSSGETKAFIDGMLVKNPFGSRLPDVANRSRFSAFLFKESTFSTGSYASSFGQALSSALTLETKDLPNKTSSEFSIISLGGGGAHTQRFKNSALIVSADYYNFDLNNTLFRQNIDWNQNPRKYQAMINYKHKTSKTGMFKAIAEYSGTNLALNLVNPNYQPIDLLTNKNKNFYFNSTYRSFLTDNLSFFAGVSYNRTDESGDVNGQLYYQDDNVWQQKLMLSSFIGANLVLSAGAEQFQSKRDEGFGNLDRGYNDVLTAVFADAELGLLKRLTLKVGLRGEHSKYIDKSNIAPRAILAWSVNEASRFSGSYGYSYAKPDDSFLAQTSNLDYEAVKLYTLDYEYKKGPRNLRVEAYYKDYDDLVKITTPVYSGFQAYGPPVQIREFNNAGYGYARGFDILWRDKKTLKIGEYYASYSFVDTKRNYIDFPDEARPSFVPMHTFNLVARKYVIKMKTQFSATYTFSSGRTYFNPNNQEFLGDKTQNNNNFSIGASYLPGWWKQFVVINFSVNNILGFNNVYGYRYAFDGTRRETILPPFKRGYLLSFLINIGDAGFNH